MGREEILRHLSTPADRRHLGTARARGRTLAASDPEVRQALAHHYRERGDLSQAGRWGIVVPGWATDEEIRHLRWWILGQSIDGDDVRYRLALRLDEALPWEVADLVDPSFRTTRAEPPASAAEGWGCLWWLIPLIAGVVAAGTLGVLVFRLATVGIGRDPALRGVVVLVVSLGVCGASWLVLRTIDRRREPLQLPDWPVPDLDFPVDLARRLLDDGDARAAQILLRHEVASASLSRRARQSLVALERDAGHADQAGRWGTPVDGLTTPQERESFAGLLRDAPVQNRLARLRALSRIDADRGDDVADVLRRAGADDSGTRPSTRGGLSRQTPVRLWWAPLLPAACGALIAVPAAAAGVPAASTVMRIALMTALAMVGATLVADAIIVRPITTPWIPVGKTAFGLVLIALSIVALLDPPSP